MLALPGNHGNMRLLITDDEKNLRQVLRTELAREGAEIDDAENGIKALELLEKNEYDIVLLDLHMPRLGGIDVLKKIKSSDFPVEVIILTANATISTAVEAMKLGAYDYLTKPFRLEELWPIVEKAYEKKKLRSENLLLKKQLKRQSGARSIIAQSAVMLELMDNVRKVAISDFPVLITGESGVGKELVAMAIHDASNVSEGPFVPINCGALPESMIESELFGFEKGAFTGATARKPGLLEMADQGTLFLDEIGDMPSPLQVKLLRVIETGRFFRLGGTRELNVNVRVLSATNKNLSATAAEGTFRQDLFYRIAAVVIHIPPLRERVEDIPLLVGNFIKNNPMFKHKRFSEESLKLLMLYPWPGNVRELQNVIQRALLLSRGELIDPSDLPLDLSGGAGIASMRLEDVEREHILRVLKASGGQRSRAAEQLGIDPKTLYRKLQAYGVKE
jgi:DNA-binding NtrC family response regulator